MILVRKEVQKTLDSLGFSSLYVRRSFDNNTPELVTKCGRPVLVFSDMEVEGRLTKAVREFVIRLINEQLKLRKEDIRRILYLLDSAADLKEPDLGIISKYDNYVMSLENYSILYQKRDKAIVIKTTPVGMPIEDVEYLQDNINQFKKDLVYYMAYVEEREKINKELGELKACRV